MFFRPPTHQPMIQAYVMAVMRQSGSFPGDSTTQRTPSQDSRRWCPRFVRLPGQRDHAVICKRQKNSGFALKAGHALGIAGHSPRKNLERHITAQCRVARTVHLTHAPCIQRRDDFLSPESRPLLKRHNFQALYTSAKAAEGTLCLGYELWMGGKCQSGTRIEHGSYWPFRAFPA